MKEKEKENEAPYQRFYLDVSYGGTLHRTALTVL